MTNVVDINTIDRYDQKSLIPTLLKKGSEHQIVAIIQSRLMELGYMDEDKPTSYFGESTETAIKKFERQIGLEEDGVCTAKIYSELMAKDAITYEVKRSDQGNDVRVLQEQLYALSYLLYEQDVNGYFGEKTEKAVIELQKSNGLTPSGKIDLTTLHTMYNENVVAYTINKKSSEDIIKVYQQKLKDLGYFYGPCNGIYTEDFRASVRNYQNANSQMPDGNIGPSTKYTLDSKYAKPFTIHLGQNNQNVKNIQNRLVELNYLISTLATGYFGDLTAQAVALFQKENNLTITGIVDGTTIETLNNKNAKPLTSGQIIKYPHQYIIDIEGIKKLMDETQKIGTVDDLLKVATLKLNSKYVRGDRGPNTFDCSGFVYWCLNQVGVNAPYMTTYGWSFSTQFERVERFDDLKPGDLIIINEHIGIVADNETVIDASSSNGKVVHRDLDEWWRDRFIIGFRVFSENSSSEVN